MALVYNAKKYYGKYVTLKSFSSRKVVTHGKDLMDVFLRAKKKGIEEPVVLYIMDPKIPHIY